MSKSIVYKVVERDSLQSTSNLDLPPRYRLTYEINKWTRPAVGRIYCFKRLSDAERFYTDTYHSIYRAEALNLRKEDWIIQLMYMNKRRLISFWTNINDMGKLNGYVFTGVAPHGSHSCTALKLLRRIL